MFHKSSPVQKFWAIATIVFTITTALVLLSAIWIFSPDNSELVGKTVATSITLAAFSFVLFLVASFSKK